MQRRGPLAHGWSGRSLQGPNARRHAACGVDELSGTDLFAASVPVYRHYLERLAGLLAKVDAVPEVLETNLQEGALTAGAHFRAAQGYVLRGICPLIGRPVTELTSIGTDKAALLASNAEVLKFLASLDANDFKNAHEQTVSHQAGFAHLNQPASEYLTRYALPNFFFHLTMGYATLRAEGVEIGKMDFDGYHQYPRGFSFED